EARRRACYNRAAVTPAVSFTRPPALRPGDPVAVVAPAGPFDRESFEAGLEVIARPHRPLFREGPFAPARHPARADAPRLPELASALAAESVRAVFVARGGYGVMRLLAALGPKLAGVQPKPLVGFSDVTALHLCLQAVGRTSIHGPVLTQLGTQPPEVVER